VAEGGGLLNRCRGLNFYPGFESLPHRQPPLMIRAEAARRSLGEGGPPDSVKSYGWQASELIDSAKVVHRSAQRVGGPHGS
jgi:hypothetical protein